MRKWVGVVVSLALSAVTLFAKTNGKGNDCATNYKNRSDCWPWMWEWHWRNRSFAAPKGINLNGSYLYNLGFLELSKTEWDFTDRPVSGCAIGVGQLCGVDPETGNMITNAVDLLPLMARSLDVAGGVNASYFVGDASGLTNLYAGALIGTVPVDRLPPEALAGGGLADWSSLTGIPAGFADGVDNDTQLSEDEVDAMVANNGYALDSALAAHVGAVDNPHGVTAAQVGAMTVTETQTAINHALTEVIVSVDTNYVYSQILTHIPPIGDLSMGSFTNSAASN
jgi:hypothetical protein